MKEKKECKLGKAIKSVGVKVLGTPVKVAKTTGKAVKTTGKACSNVAIRTAFKIYTTI